MLGFVAVEIIMNTPDTVLPNAVSSYNAFHKLLVVHRKFVKNSCWGYIGRNAQCRLLLETLETHLPSISALLASPKVLALAEPNVEPSRPPPSPPASKPRASKTPNAAKSMSPTTSHRAISDKISDQITDDIACLIEAQTNRINKHSTTKPTPLRPPSATKQRTSQ